MNRIISGIFTISTKVWLLYPTYWFYLLLAKFELPAKWISLRFHFVFFFHHFGVTILAFFPISFKLVSVLCLSVVATVNFHCVRTRNVCVALHKYYLPLELGSCRVFCFHAYTHWRTMLGDNLVFSC